jgi:hypothetical protein
MFARIGSSLCLTYCVLGCGGSAGTAAFDASLQQEAGAPVQSAGRDIALDPTAVFSYRFYDDTPQGVGVAVVVASNISAQALCAQLSDGTAPRDDWSLRAFVGSARAGDYPVSFKEPLAGDAEALAVLSQHTSSGEREYKAADGVVTLGAVPTPDANATGKTADVSLRLRLPTRPRRVERCMGGIEADGTPSDQECLCRDGIDDAESRCTPETVGLECCAKNGLEASGLGEQLAIEVKAEFCRGYCRSVGSVDLCTRKLGATAQTDAGRKPGECDNPSCSGNLWPRLALRSMASGLALSALRVQTSGGFETKGDSAARCPVEGEFGCDMGVFANPSEASAKVDVLGADGTTVLQSRVVALAPHNACAEDIAYVTIEGTATAPLIGEPSFRSPCAR